MEARSFGPRPTASPLSLAGDLVPDNAVDEHWRKRGDLSTKRGEQLIDIFTTRGILEERAARLAACHLTEKHVKTLDEVVRAMEAAARSMRSEELSSLDRQLHFTIYRAANRPHMERIIEQLWVDWEACVPSGEALPDLSPDGKHVLRSIVSACELRDENAMGIMVRYKIHRSASLLLDSRGLD